MRSVGESVSDERDPGREAVAHRLREMPNEAAPPFDWSGLRRRMQMKSTRTPMRSGVVTAGAQAGARRALSAILGAAVIAMAVLAAGRIERFGVELKGPRPDVQRALPVRAGAPLSAARGSEAEAPLARADSAERWLADRPDDAALVQVSTHLAVDNLEDRIASMDDLLNVERLQHAHPARLRTLQLQRAQLVDSLAQVRYAEMLVEETP
ncbi:MAG: hypothetical protein ACREU2_11640 [Steroidobacteraceae bacterium]